jgi:hypothetical protein
VSAWDAAAKMIRFDKSAQDGWLQEQLFLQRSLAAATVDQIYLCGKVQSRRIVSRFTLFEAATCIQNEEIELLPRRFYPSDIAVTSSGSVM